MPAPATVPATRPPATPAQAYGAPRPAGHGQRLTAAFDALERFPALAESRNRVLDLVSQDRPSTGDVVAAIESDVALVIAVLRLGNQLEGDRHGRVESVVDAVEVLSPEAVQGLASSAEVFEFFER
ncbi:MAG: HDOD domain-containing protein, partial [Solirubrobacteraceae bacterium]